MHQSTAATRTRRHFPTALRLMLFGSMALMALAGIAGAAATLDTALNPAAQQICVNLRSISNSAFVSVIALVMFVGGLFMVWLKMRGGLGMAAFGLVGFFIVKQLVPLARSFGIIPAGIPC